jgi:hypothetical protein
MDDQNPQATSPRDEPPPVVFNFGNQNVRIIDRDGEVWFVAADVCKVLKHTNTSKAVEPLDDDEKGLSNVYTLGGDQALLTVNESGLYSLIFTSRLPKAKDFKKWVTKEVLPEIRKTGRYEVNQDAINPQLSPVADEIKVILPSSGLYLVSAKENGPHIVEPTADDELELLCVHLSFDHLCYAVKL